MIDNDLADLYAVPTKRLNEQVKRNAKRFPSDFMFQLTAEEWANLKSQIATSSWGGRRTLPYAFTEHGVLMLSSVLNSDRAILVNVQIMRIYIKFRKWMTTNKDVLLKVKTIEAQLEKHEQSFLQIFTYLKELIAEKSSPADPIGFKTGRQKREKSNG